MKHVIFTMGLLALVSCKDGKNEATTTKSEVVENAVDATEEQTKEAASDVYANAWMSEIQMDNGSKWPSDVQTNQGAQKLQNSMQAHTTVTLDDYHKLAEDLNTIKNTLVKECTMTGPPHDNLHIWLHPLIEKIAALTTVENLDDAKNMKQSIAENINGYNTYFK
jgi:ABC-type Zn2+ transport system substrate-binding protein/surface adhesin